jgi:hypothetical protein
MEAVKAATNNFILTFRHLKSQGKLQEISLKDIDPDLIKRIIKKERLKIKRNDIKNQDKSLSTK